MPDEKLEPTPAAAPPKKKGPMKLVIIGVLALVLIGGAAAAVMMMGGSEEHGEEAEEHEEVPMPDLGPIVEIGDFTVNLNDTSGQRYLRVKINLELNGEAEEGGGHGGGHGGGGNDEIKARLPVMRDALVLLLSSQRPQDVASSEGKEALKEAIRLRLEEFLRPGAIRRVLFVEFLVQ